MRRIKLIVAGTGKIRTGKLARMKEMDYHYGEEGLLMCAKRTLDKQHNLPLP